MSKTGLVSIITPVFNSAATLQETLESVLAQTYNSWEMLCVFDSGTADSSREIVRQYQARDSRFRLIELEKEKGCGAARNEGFRQAQGQFIAFLDADDLWLKEKLENQIRWMQEKNLAFTCTGYQRMSHDGVLGNTQILPKDVATYEDILKNNSVCCPTVVINQDLTGPFSMKNTYAEDMILWLELIKKGFPCHGLKDVLLHYRVAEKSRSSFKVKVLKARWNVYRNFAKISRLASTYYFLMYFFSAVWKRR